MKFAFPGIQSSPHGGFLFAERVPPLGTGQYVRQSVRAGMPNVLPSYPECFIRVK